jgi:predicted amidophosphoribosyltransferase
VGLLDLVFPRQCLGCGEPAAELCLRCRDGLLRIRPPLCERCGAPTAWPVERCAQCARKRLAFASARSAVCYDETVRRLVAGWKERGLRRLADLAAELVQESIERPAGVVMTFVPPDRDRTLKRGHHPAERLARGLAELWDLSVEPLLVRPHSGPPQRGLPLAERRRNVAGAFRPRAVGPRTVILVDDVYTTGSTANAASSALRRGGARSVSVITFARVVR